MENLSAADYDEKASNFRRVRSGDLVKVLEACLPYAHYSVAGTRAPRPIPIGEYALVIATERWGELLHIRKYIQTVEEIDMWAVWVNRRCVERIRSSRGKRFAWEPLNGKVCRAGVEL
jgi:hypothetical protein